MSESKKNTPSSSTVLSRRGFLASAIAGATGLLAGCKDQITKSKLLNERETDPNYFVLLADTHVDYNPASVNNQGANISEINELTAKRILNIGPRLPAGVIMNGDMVNARGMPSDYGIFFWIYHSLEKAGIPLHTTIGEHDNLGNFYRAFTDHVPDEILVRNRHVKVLETPNVRIFLLDTVDARTQTGSGLLGNIQLLWLDNTLQELNDKPIILFGHHYPWNDDERGLADSNEFFEIIHKYDHVKAYFFGHSHRWEIDKNEDVYLVNQPANGGDIEDDQPTGFIHARFHNDRVELELDCFDRKHSLHGTTTTLKY
jgi:3',5'-cyclic-AMP phosphodiesterase